MPNEKNNKQYFIEVVAKALDVLDLFENDGVELTISGLSDRLQLTRTSVFRLLYTLEKRGWVERTKGGKKFRRVNRSRRYRVGYGMLGSQFAFSIDVSRGIQEAAERYGIQLLISDNCFNGEIALMNARMFIQEHVDFVIQCQGNERIAPVIAHLLGEAKIPSLAIDIPQPGATFFGGNNYKAGLIAGHALGQAARSHWEGKVDKVVLLEYPDAGPTPQARMTGALHGIEEVLASVARTDVLHLDCRGTFLDSYKIMLNLLKSVPTNARMLVAAINDPSAVGAVRALESLHRENMAFVVGQNATREARAELRKKEKSCLLGSVGYFPEQYGEQIIPLVLKMIDGIVVPPAVYVEHALVSRENVMNYYPGDTQLQDDTERKLETEMLSEASNLRPVSVLFG